MARQFNLIPAVAEQAEYHLFQRDKVEVAMPELYHKIGTRISISQHRHKHNCCFLSKNVCDLYIETKLYCAGVTGNILGQQLILMIYRRHMELLLVC